MAAVPTARSAEPRTRTGAVPTPRPANDRVVGIGGERAVLDEVRLAELYRTHDRALFRYLVGRTFGDVHLAEDIMQETFLRAWMDGQSGNCRPWLMTVARNLVIDQLRYRARRPHEVGDGALPNVAASDCEMDRVVTALTVQEAMATLTPLRREILNQMFLQDRPPKQVAETLGIPIGTVRSRAHYALRALRLALAEQQPAGQITELCAA